jgi:hypothetical protein
MEEAVEGQEPQGTCTMLDELRELIGDEEEDICK